MMSRFLPWSGPRFDNGAAPDAIAARTGRPRRALGEAFLHAPQVLRALVRADEIWLVALAAAVQEFLQQS